MFKVSTRHGLRSEPMGYVYVRATRVWVYPEIDGVCLRERLSSARRLMFAIKVRLCLWCKKKEKKNRGYGIRNSDEVRLIILEKKEREKTQG